MADIQFTKDNLLVYMKELKGNVFKVVVSEYNRNGGASREESFPGFERSSDVFKKIIDASISGAAYPQLCDILGEKAPAEEVA